MRGIVSVRIHRNLSLIHICIWDFWDEYGTNRERIGELIQRVGLAAFLDGIGLDPVPEMISAPRDNPYIYYQPAKEDEA